MDELRPANYLDITRLLFNYRTRYRVDGPSMLPVLKHGDHVSVDKNADLAVGDIVVAQHPFKTDVEMIKRISKIDENGNYFLIGDNPDESTDSRTFGAVSVECIKGKVVCRLGKSALKDA